MNNQKSNNLPTNNTFTEFMLYKTPDGKVKIEIFLRDENIWLTQDKMAELFGVQRPAITKHLKNIFETGELDEEVVCSKMELTTQHGAMDGKTQTSPVKFYNLDAIIALGYRVNSKKATHFRIWATQILKEYIIKGFAMDKVSRIIAQVLVIHKAKLSKAGLIKQGMMQELLTGRIRLV